MNPAFDAMVFAHNRHAEHKRKYTGAPYTDHLAEVAGIVSTVVDRFNVVPGVMIAVAWLHDVVEDHGVEYKELVARFGIPVAEGVKWLTDSPKEVGNRATRKARDRERLASAPAWVQTIKVADLISNSRSIVEHDPKFARVYLAEKEELLKVLTRADRRLFELAELVLEAGREALKAGENK